MGRARGTQSGSASDWASRGMVFYWPLTKLLASGRATGESYAPTKLTQAGMYLSPTVCTGSVHGCKFSLLHLRPWTGVDPSDPSGKLGQ